MSLDDSGTALDHTSDTVANDAADYVIAATVNDGDINVADTTPPRRERRQSVASCDASEWPEATVVNYTDEGAKVRRSRYAARRSSLGLLSTQSPVGVSVRRRSSLDSGTIQMHALLNVTGSDALVSAPGSNPGQSSNLGSTMNSTATATADTDVSAATDMFKRSLRGRRCSSLLVMSTIRSKSVPESVTPVVSLEELKKPLPSYPSRRRSGVQLWDLVRRKFRCGALAAMRRFQLMTQQKDTAEQAIADGKVTVDSEGPQLDATQQGNWDEFYTDEAIQHRAKLLDHPEIVAIIRKVWLYAVGHKPILCMTEEEYITLFTIVSRELLPEVDLKTARQRVKDDWVRDSENGKTLGWRRFLFALFEVVDNWVDSLEAEEYVRLAASLLGVISESYRKPIPKFTTDKDGAHATATLSTGLLARPRHATTNPSLARKQRIANRGKAERQSVGGGSGQGTGAGPAPPRLAVLATTSGNDIVGWGDTEDVALASLETTLPAHTPLRVAAKRRSTTTSALSFAPAARPNPLSRDESVRGPSFVVQAIAARRPSGDHNDRRLSGDRRRRPSDATTTTTTTTATADTTTNPELEPPVFKPPASRTIEFQAKFGARAPSSRGMKRGSVLRAAPSTTAADVYRVDADKVPITSPFFQAESSYAQYENQVAVLHGSTSCALPPTTATTDSLSPTNDASSVCPIPASDDRLFSSTVKGVGGGPRTITTALAARDRSAHDSTQFTAFGPLSGTQVGRSSPAPSRDENATPDPSSRPPRRQSQQTGQQPQMRAGTGVQQDTVFVLSPRATNIMSDMEPLGAVLTTTKVGKPPAASQRTTSSRSSSRRSTIGGAPRRSQGTRSRLSRGGLKGASMDPSARESYVKAVEVNRVLVAEWEANQSSSSGSDPAPPESSFGSTFTMPKSSSDADASLAVTRLAPFAENDAFDVSDRVELSDAANTMGGGAPDTVGRLGSMTGLLFADDSVSSEFSLDHTLSSGLGGTLTSVANRASHFTPDLQDAKTSVFTASTNARAMLDSLCAPSSPDVMQSFMSRSASVPVEFGLRQTTLQPSTKRLSAPRPSSLYAVSQVPHGGRHSRMSVGARVNHSHAPKRHDPQMLPSIPTRKGHHGALKGMPQFNALDDCQPTVPVVRRVKNTRRASNANGTQSLPGGNPVIISRYMYVTS